VPIAHNPSTQETSRRNIEVWPGKFAGLLPITYPCPAIYNHLPYIETFTKLQDVNIHSVTHSRISTLVIVLEISYQHVQFHPSTA
jgi:hypothetical protein